MFRSGSIPASRALLYGTLAVGVLDLLDAFVFFGLRSGVRPIRILHSIASGLLYGIAVYLTMTFVVVPASAAAGGTPPWPVALNGVLIHMFGVGLPAALAARAAK